MSAEHLQVRPSFGISTLWGKVLVSLHAAGESASAAIEAERAEQLAAQLLEAARAARLERDQALTSWPPIDDAIERP